MRSRPLYDIVALFARLGAGLVFMAHGWQKIEAGMTATGRSFDSLGVPLPTGAAVYAAFVELLGGAALILGLGLPVVGILLFVDMAGAFVFVHGGEGLFMVDQGRAANGYELVLVLGLLSLLFAAGAGGRLTLDRWLFGGRLRRPSRNGGEDDEDEASFVESLREAETRPALEKPAAAKPARKPARKTPPGQPAKPTTPEAAARPAEPADKPGGQPGDQPRLASGILGTEDDTLVAGRRKSGRRRRPSDSTRPTERDGGEDA